MNQDEPAGNTAAGAGRGGAALLVLGLLLALGAVRRWTEARLTPPAPAGPAAPAGDFSAGRALEVLGRLLGDGAPHPLGSAASAAVRGRIVDELEALGLSPEVQTAFVRFGGGRCAVVHNVVARLGDGAPEDEGSPRAILFSAHYDSVPAGPGASDDGVGVAVGLEAARALLASRPPANPVILLFNEGEELGLLGAQAFVHQHPWARDVAVALNVEARGTAGPSLMFQTGPDDAWLVDLFARTATRPISSSLFDSIYERMPNDTDLSVYMEAGWPGLNFAHIDRVEHYHTPLDDLAHVDAGSLQHHGTNVLALLRALGDRDLTTPPRGDASFFDVQGLLLLRWPERLTPLVALFAAGLWTFAALRFARARAVDGRQFRRAAGGLLLGFLAPPVVGFALKASMEFASPGSVTWLTPPPSAWYAAWSLSWAAALFVYSRLSRRTSPEALHLACWSAWTAAALGLALFVPGAAYPALVPALGAGATLVLAGRKASGPGLGGPFVVAVAVPTLLAALVGCPIAVGLEWVAGLATSATASLPAAIGGSTLAAAIAACGARTRRALPLVALVVGLVALGRLLSEPLSSPERPRRIDLLHLEDADAHQAWWLVAREVSTPDPWMRGLAAFTEGPVQPLPWSQRAPWALSAGAPPLGLDAPRLELLEEVRAENARVLRLRLVPGAPETAVALHTARRVRLRWLAPAPFQEPAETPTELREPTRPGTDRPGRAATGGTWGRSFECLTPPSDGIECELRIRDSEALEAWVSGTRFGLAPDHPLGGARAPTDVPHGQGDRTLTFRRVEL